MAEKTYIIAIDGDEQYRTTNRGQAKAVYNLLDEQYERRRSEKTVNRVGR